MPTTSRNSSRTIAATPRPTAISAIPSTTARRSWTRYAATGRWRFVGWRRSASMSRTSLSRYVPLATRQNDRNASATLPITSPCVRTPAAPGAARMSTFFAHCLGRRARRTSRAAGTAGALRLAGSSGAKAGAGVESAGGSEVSSPSATRRSIVGAPTRPIRRLGRGSGALVSWQSEGRAHLVRVQLLACAVRDQARGRRPGLVRVVRVGRRGECHEVAVDPAAERVGHLSQVRLDALGRLLLELLEVLIAGHDPLVHVADPDAELDVGHARAGVERLPEVGTGGMDPRVDRRERPSKFAHRLAPSPASDDAGREQDPHNRGGQHQGGDRDQDRKPRAASPRGRYRGGRYRRGRYRGGRDRGARRGGRGGRRLGGGRGGRRRLYRRRRL